MSHNPPVVNPRFTEDMRQRFEEAADFVMKSPTLSPILQGRTQEEWVPTREDLMATDWETGD